ncbi:MAG: threonine/serine dehydratase [Ignavibacteriae bacterium]|nr:threonine/serine dehydratase [Ignavibacteriota bacterium]NOG99043.1 threonine/serine dehydratase [Ignavibacteriota bacterium]
MHEPTHKDILQSASRIFNHIHKTPILTSRLINKICGANLFFKCENLQKVGAFKFRGASNAVLTLDKNYRANGVATHSSGNHAAALALSAKNNGIKSFIVMPSNAPIQKKNAVQEYGAKIIYCKPTLEARESTLEKVVEETGAVFIHPYNNHIVIAGQATCAMEIFNDISNLDYLIAPVGGGGLLSGTCLSAKYISPSTKVIGAEPEGADDAYRSIRDGKIYPSVEPKTICDGLRTSLGVKTFSILNKYVYEIITVPDKATINAMRLIWERMKIIVEPSSAIVLAAVIQNKSKFANKKVGLILSGGNVDLNNLPF